MASDPPSLRFQLAFRDEVIERERERVLGIVEEAVTGVWFDALYDRCVEQSLPGCWGTAHGTEFAQMTKDELRRRIKEER